MNGVLIVACGHPIYGNMAFNCALSLQKQVPITVVYSEKALEELSDEQLKWFDKIIECPSSLYTSRGTRAYQRVKVYANKVTPYDTTILLDADTIWNDKPIDPLFEKKQIQTCGYWTAEKELSTKYTYWGNPREMADHFRVKKIYKTYGGFLCFDQDEPALKKAQQAYDDSICPYTKWAGDKPDEFAFNVGYGIREIDHDYRPIHFPYDKAKYTWYTMQNNYYGFTFAGAYPDNYILSLAWNRLRALSAKHNIPHQTNISKSILEVRKHF